METQGEPHNTELDRIVEALEGGDAAFAATLVGRYGRAIAAAVADLGVRHEVERIVHEVALALVGRPRPAGLAAWEAVHVVIEEVVSGDRPDNSPDPGVGISLRLHGRVEAGIGAMASDVLDTGRTLHLVDVDNLVGGPRADVGWFGTAIREYEAVAGIGPDDQVVLAAEVSLYKRTCFEVDGWDYKPGFGEDGADRVLLEAAPADWVADRFDRLVIGSGDHAFTELAAEVAGDDTDVVTVSRPRSLSQSLRLASTEVRYLADLGREADYAFVA